MPAESKSRESKSLATTPRASLHAVDPASLGRLSMAELHELFADLELAELSQLQGRKRGHVLAFAGLDWLPAPVRRALLARGPWRGQHVDGEFGSNTWLIDRLEFAHYVVRTAEAIDGSGPVLRLDYDVAINPKPLRGFIGELRYLAPGLCLARTWYVLGERTLPVSYLLIES
jgi:hypothetical protein